MLKSFALFLMAMMLVACGNVKPMIKEVPVYHIETVYVTVPSYLLKLNVAPPPPKKSVYINASDEVKEDLMIRYSQSLISELRMCVADKRAITKIMNEKVKAGEERDAPKKESK